METSHSGREWSWTRDKGSDALANATAQAYDRYSWRNGRFSTYSDVDVDLDGQALRAGAVTTDNDSWGKEGLANETKTTGLVNQWVEWGIPTVEKVTANGAYDSRQGGTVGWADGKTHAGQMEDRSKRTGHETVEVTEIGTVALVRDGTVTKNNASKRDGDYTLTDAQKTEFAPNGKSTGTGVTETVSKGNYTNTVSQFTRENYVPGAGFREMRPDFTLNGEYEASDKVTRPYVDGQEAPTKGRRVISTRDTGTLGSDYSANETAIDGLREVKSSASVKGRQATDDRVTTT